MSDVVELQIQGKGPPDLSSDVDSQPVFLEVLGKPLPAFDNDDVPLMQTDVNDDNSSDSANTTCRSGAPSVTIFLSVADRCPCACLLWHISAQHASGGQANREARAEPAVVPAFLSRRAEVPVQTPAGGQSRVDQERR